MKTLSGLSATPLQTFQAPVCGGIANFTLRYHPATKNWFIDMTVNDIEIYNMRVCHNLNLYAQYADVLNCGLYVAVNGIVEPVSIDDFSTGRATLNILSPDEINLIEGGYSLLK